MTTSRIPLLSPYRTFVLRHPHLFDIVALGSAAVALCAALLHLFFEGGSLGGFAALAIEVTGIVLSRRLPWTGLILFAGAPLLAVVTGNDPQVSWTMSVVGVFYICLRGVPGLWAGLLVAVGNYISVSTFEGSGLGATAPVAAVLAFAAAAAGSAIRGQRQYWQELEDRARDALSTREMEASRRVAEERLRIARDLHDVVGHQIAIVNMHLGLAEVSLLPNQDRARGSLHAARSGVQAVLRETQHILNVLRVSADPDESQPVAEYDQIFQLVESFRVVGLQVEANLIPPPAHLPTEVSAAAYRIVQESLTNVQRHGVGTVSITSAMTAEALIVTVASPMKDRMHDPERRGYGLVGMRERAGSAGGSLRAGDIDGTFTVIADLPLTQVNSR